MKNLNPNLSAQKLSHKTHILLTHHFVRVQSCQIWKIISSDQENKNRTTDSCNYHFKIQTKQSTREIVHTLSTWRNSTPDWAIFKNIKLNVTLSAHRYVTIDATKRQDSSAAASSINDDDDDRKSKLPTWDGYDIVLIVHEKI